MNQLDVVTVGMTMIDLLCAGLPHMPEIGESIQANNYYVDIGGGATINAIGLSKLGLKVALVATCGKDLLGEIIYDKLQAYGIDLSCFVIDESNKTNFSIEITFSKDRATICTGFPNRAVTYDAIRDLLVHSKHLHIRGIDEHKSDLFKFAIERGLTTSLNAHFQKKEELELLPQTLPFIDLLIINEREIHRLIEENEDFFKTVIKLGKLTRQYCVVTMGVEGAVFSNGNELVEVKGFPVEAIDTVGAGDAFSAGFIFAYLRELPIEVCATIGNAMGSLNVRSIGGASGLANMEQLKSFLSSEGYYLDL